MNINPNYHHKHFLSPDDHKTPGAKTGSNVTESDEQPALTIADSVNSHFSEVDNMLASITQIDRKYCQISEEYQQKRCQLAVEFKQNHRQISEDFKQKCLQVGKEFKRNRHQVALEYKQIEQNFHEDIKYGIIGKATEYVDRLKPLHSKTSGIYERLITVTKLTMLDKVVELPELLWEISNYLSTTDLLTLSKVNRYFYHLARDIAAERYCQSSEDEIAELSRSERNTIPEECERRLRSLSMYRASLYAHNLSTVINSYDQGCGSDKNGVQLTNLFFQVSYPENVKNIILKTPWNDDYKYSADPLLAIKNDLPEYSNLQSIELSRYYNIGIKSFEHLANSCTKLRKIILNGTAIKEEAIKILTEKCKEVVSFTYANPCYDLVRKHVQSYFSDNITRDAISAIHQNWSHLKELIMTDCGPAALPAVENLMELTHLDLGHTSNSDLVQNSKVEQWLSASNRCSTRLEVLHLCSIANITDEVISNFAKRCKNLKDVDFSSCPLLTSTAVCSLVESCPNLTSVKLSWVKGVTDQDLPVLLQLKHLKVLDLSDTSITLDGLSRFKQDLMHSQLQVFRFGSLNNLIPRDGSLNNKSLWKYISMTTETFRNENPEFIKRFNL